MMGYIKAFYIFSLKFFHHFYPKLRETAIIEIHEKIQNKEIRGKSFIKRTKRMWKKYKFDFITYADFF
jgi:hypothetical protein